MYKQKLNLRLSGVYLIVLCALLFVGCGKSEEVKKSKPKKKAAKKVKEKEYNGKTTAEWIKQLEDDDDYLLDSAMTNLEWIDESAVPLLITALQDPDVLGKKRWRAAEVLGKIGDASAIPVLIKSLQDKDHLVRTRSAFALADIGKPAVDPLIKMLCGKDKLARSLAYLALEKMDKPAVPGLIKLLREGVKERKITAITL